MGGIASAIIISPPGSGPDKGAPGFRGENVARRVAAVQAIAPKLGNALRRQTDFNSDDSTRGRARDNREVRQLAIRENFRSDADSRSGRTAVAVAGAVVGPGAVAGTVVGPGADRAGLPVFSGAAFASIQFLAQVIGQAEEPSSEPAAYHPDSATLGSDAYRRAGATPPHYREQPTVFRITI